LEDNKNSQFGLSVRNFISLGNTNCLAFAYPLCYNFTTNEFFHFGSHIRACILIVILVDTYWFYGVLCLCVTELFVRAAGVHSACTRFIVNHKIIIVNYYFPLKIIHSLTERRTHQASPVMSPIYRDLMFSILVY
jgi:putative flippase GtrA